MKRVIFNFILVLVILFSLQEQAVKAIPENISYSKTSQLFAQGIENTKNNNYQQALSDFTRVINLKANFVSAAYSNRCLVNLKLGNNQAAKSDCTAALLLNPDNWETYLNRGLAEYRLGNYQEAINQYQKVIQGNEDDYRAYYNQGLAYFALANYREAGQNYEQALLSLGSSSPAVQALIYSEKGLTNFILGNSSQAIADLNKAIRLDNVNENAYYNRACVYRKERNYIAALNDFSKAVQLNAQYAEAYQNRGWLRHELGLEQAAIKDLNKALQQFERQGKIEASQQTLTLIEHLHEILAQSNRILAS